MLLDPVFLARNRFQAVAHTQVGLHQPVHLGHVAPGDRAQGLDATRILGDKFQQFQAIAMGQGLGDAG